MKRLLAIFLSLFLLVLFIKPAASKGIHSISIPKGAKEIAPGVFDLGESLDVDGRQVQGFMIVKREGAQNGAHGNAGAKTNNCYSYLANGAKWKNNENYMVDPTNLAGLGSNAITSIVSNGIGKWETVSGGVDVMGNETAWTGDEVDTVSPDGKNEVMFGDITNSGVIAATTVWGVFYGPPSARYLVEWDQIYDDVSFGWATNGDLTKMDFDNIATHEIGHAFGMGHPSDSCTEETMYRYASLGEIKKRDLNAGDIAGIDKLY